MVSYRVHQKQLSELLQVQFIYENSPVFAGTDEFSLLVRFRYTGDISDQKVRINLKDPFLAQDGNREDSEDVKIFTSTDNNTGSMPKQEEEAKKEGGSWFGSRLSSQFSNATRSLFLQNLSKLNEEDENDGNESSLLKKEKNQGKVTMFLGYGQIFGHYSINDTIIDYSIFKDLQKSTIIEGKYAGIQGLNVTDLNDEENLGIFSGLNTLFNSEMNSLSESKIVDHMKFIPFYTTNQNILFSELVFDPEHWTSESKTTESIKSFYINCQLPKDLPPTYCTEAIQINYNFVLGYQLMEDQNIVSKTVFVPLKIQPFIDNYGRQPVYHLEKVKLNTFIENLIIEDVSENQSLMRATSENSQPIGQPRRISFWSLKKNITKNKSRRSSSTVLESSSDRRKSSTTSNINFSVADEKVKDFLEILDSLDKSDVNDIIKIQERFEHKINESNLFQFNIRENLMQIMGDYKYVQRQKISKRDFDEHLEYDHLLPKEQQTKYIIKQNHGIISTLLLNRSIFKLGDLININVSFEGSRYETKGVEFQLLKHQIFHREEYLKRGNYDEVSSRLDNNTLETVLYEKVMSTFDAQNINTDILIPVETEPQFKTNFFTVKYYLQVRFIIIDSYGKIEEFDRTDEVEEPQELEGKVSYDMKNIFIDTTGSMLFRAKENLSNSNEFYVRIPVIVLPTYEQDFGLFTNKI